jgi:peroxiredoxin
MPTTERRLPIQRGELAPNFTVPAIDRDGVVSLADYRGKSAVVIGLFRGMYCPLCRRKIAQMGSIRDKLLNLEAEALAIVGSRLDHARLYFRSHTAHVPLAADPEMSVARAFSVPKPPVTPQLLETLRSTLVDPFNELAEPVPITEIAMTLNQLDRYEMNETDLQEV